MIAPNVTAPMRLGYAAVPGYLARGRGAIINIASIVAIAPEILNGVYGGSKALLLALSQSLHHELAARGLRIQAVLPGATVTEFWATGGLPLEKLDAAIVMSAEDLVDAALVGFDRDERVTIPSLHAGEDGMRSTRYGARWRRTCPAMRWPPAISGSRDPADRSRSRCR